MDKRVRSPNYPSLSLPDAVQKVRLVYQNQHTHGAPRDVVVKSMGYNSLNGASATAVSALAKYGLLDGRGEEIRVSERAMQILHPQSPEERAAALHAAAAEPILFKELDEKFPGRLPSEEILRNYLLRNGFAPSAVSGVILAYRETKEFVEREAGAYDSAPVADTEPLQMHATTAPSAPQVHQVAPKIQVIQEVGRTVFRYDFEGGNWLKFDCSPGVTTEEALAMAETLIDLKRKELARIADRAVPAPEEAKADEHKAGG